MKELRAADIFGFAEIIQTLQHGTKQKWEQVTRKFFNHSRSIHSESDIPTDNYKPGGTLTSPENGKPESPRKAVSTRA
jgi:hypothetical protein